MKRLTACLLVLVLLTGMIPAASAAALPGYLEVRNMETISVTGVLKQVHVDDEFYPADVLMVFPDMPMKLYFEDYAQGEPVNMVLDRFQVGFEGSGWEAYLNKRVTVMGKAMPQHTAHHYTKLVLVDAQAADPDYPFTDVDPCAYYYTPLLWALQMQVTSGTSASTFSPGAPCTRAQLVTFLWRAWECQEPATKSLPFRDVSPNAYYYKALCWAYEKQLISGLTETSFGPDKTCTRAQMITLLWRTAQRPDYAAMKLPFRDVPRNSYYYQAVCWGLDRSITVGTSGTTFSPGAPCTRAQIVTFLFRFMIT